MAECNIQALFIWINDNPVSGNILRLSAIVNPRRDYEEYKVGERVLVKCPGHGNVQGVIGVLGGTDQSEKKKLEKFLKSTEHFTQLLKDLEISQNGTNQFDPIPDEDVDIARKKSPKKQTMQNPKKKTVDECETHKKKEGSTKSKSQKKVKQNTEKENVVPNENIENDTRQTQQTLSEPIQSKTQNKVTVVKPKPIRRNTSVDNSEAEKKKLKLVAEDLAITSLSQSCSREPSPDLTSTGMLIGSSLHLLNSSPSTLTQAPSTQAPSTAPSTKASSAQAPSAQAPSAQAPSTQAPYQTAFQQPYQNEVQELRSRLEYTEYSVRYMWNEFQVMKTELESLKANKEKPPLAPVASDQQTSSSSVRVTDQHSLHVSPPAEQIQVQTEPEQDATVAIPSTVTVYNGLTKDQLMAELQFFKTAKRGTTRLFRMLYTKEETSGRSLFGQQKQGCDFRPGLADKKKLLFLEDCIIQQWPATKKQDIWSVIRHLLKPSRTKSAMD